MAAKVYVCAVLLAGIGVGLAALDRQVRPIPSVEQLGQKGTDANDKSGPAKPDETKAPPLKDGAPAATPPAQSPNQTPVQNPGSQPAQQPTQTPTQPPAQTPVQTPATTPGSEQVKVLPDLNVATLPAKLELDQAYTLFTQGANFIDGRKADEYAAMHVENAANLRNDDVQQNTKSWQDFFQAANQDDVYVVYCYGKDCHEADQLRETLKAVGFKQVFVMTSSIEQWHAAGGPVAK